MSSAPSGADLPFLDHLAAQSARFRDVLADAPPGVTVPTCPDWDTDDLLWHLTDVQWFWGEIAENGLTEHEQVAAMGDRRPHRPTDREGLLRAFDTASSRLHGSLSALAPETELWMWADEHTARYVRRRQAHESLVHRFDAEATAGIAPADRAPVDARLAADGIDEALRIMRGYEPEPGLRHQPVGAPVTVAAVDTMHAWTVTPVRVTGAYEGEDVDIVRFTVSDGAGDAAAEVSGAAADLDCWLWNRPLAGEVTRTGDAEALAAADRVLGSSID
jgi:uncharacterized protein (TIGR03083 family)